MKRIISMALAAAIGPLAAPAIESPNQWAFARRLYGDPKARAVGDLLTVLIVESSSSSKQAAMKTGKKTSTAGSFQFAHPRLDNNPTSWTNAYIPKWGVSADRSFEGGGESKNEEKITATLTVRVMEVLPNGNLMIEGKRSLHVMGEEMQYVLSGTVRPTDVSRENTVRSTAIADLSIQCLSDGPISSSQKKGLFDRVVDWVNPF